MKEIRIRSGFIEFDRIRVAELILQPGTTEDDIRNALETGSMNGPGLFDEDDDYE